MDRETGRSRGFGFVTFGDTEAASAAVQAMDQRVYLSFFFYFIFNDNGEISNFDMRTYKKRKHF